MTRRLNVSELVQAGRRDEALALLSQPIPIAAAVGRRSAAVALAAATLLFEGDVENTARWMTRRNVHLGATPLAYAEQSDEGQERVLEMINQLRHGIYL